MTELECECKTHIDCEFPFYLDYTEGVSYCKLYEELKASPDIEIYYMRDTQQNRTIKAYSELTPTALFEIIRKHYGNITKFLVKINDGANFKVVPIDYPAGSSSPATPLKNNHITTSSQLGAKLKDLPTNVTLAIYI